MQHRDSGYLRFLRDFAEATHARTVRQSADDEEYDTQMTLAEIEEEAERWQQAHVAHFATDGGDNNVSA